MVIGLTGGIGSGKTTVAEMFSAFDGVVLYNADVEAKQLMTSSSKIRTKLIEEFTADVYKGGVLNRVFLANIVFKDKEKLKVLNSIVHPVVHEHLHNFITSHSSCRYILYENAILFENGSDQLCDKIITVTAPEDVKILRVMARDKSSKSEVLGRMKNQWDDEKKTLQSHYVIENQSLKDVSQLVLDIHNKLT